MQWNRKHVKHCCGLPEYNCCLGGEKLFELWAELPSFFFQGTPFFALKKQLINYGHLDLGIWQIASQKSMCHSGNWLAEFAAAIKPTFSSENSHFENLVNLWAWPASPSLYFSHVRFMVMLAHVILVVVTGSLTLGASVSFCEPVFSKWSMCDGTESVCGSKIHLKCVMAQ